MRLIDATPALFMIALSAAIVAGTGDLPYWADITPGARFFPVWLAGTGILLALLLLANLYSDPAGGRVEIPDARAVVRVGLTTGGMIGFIVLTPFVGMVLAGALFMAFLLLVVLRQPLMPSLLTVAIVALGVEGIFVRWLGVALPAFPFSI